MMNDGRNGSYYRCVVMSMGVTTNESNTTYLFVAGEYVRIYECYETTNYLYMLGCT